MSSILNRELAFSAVSKGEAVKELWQTQMLCLCPKSSDWHVAKGCYIWHCVGLLICWVPGILIGVAKICEDIKDLAALCVY